MDKTARVTPAERPAEFASAVEQAELETTPETVDAARPEQPETEQEQAVGETPAAEAATRSAAAPVAPAVHKDPMLAQIEQVLQDGVFEAYMAMGPADRERFKTRGEQVAGEIQRMVAKGKVHMQRIWQIIRDWLKLIPGVSSLFVEQEAKIKTDRVLLLARRTP